MLYYTEVNVTVDRKTHYLLRNDTSLNHPCIHMLRDLQGSGLDTYGTRDSFALVIMIFYTVKFLCCNTALSSKESTMYIQHIVRYNYAALLCTQRHIAHLLNSVSY
jgi:hypothetical protein